MSTPPTTTVWKIPRAWLVAAASCAALVVGSAAVATLLGPWARGRSAGWLSDNISSNIAGELRIDEVKSWSMTGLTLGQVQLLDTQGRTVINLPTLELRIALPRLLNRTVSIQEALAEGASLRLLDTGGVPSLVGALAPADPQAPPSGWQVNVQDLQISGATVAGTVPGLGKIAGEGLRLKAGLRLGDSTLAWLQDISVDLESERTGAFRIVRGSGKLQHDTALKAQLRLRSARRAEIIDARLDVQDEDDRPAKLDIQAFSTALDDATLGALGLPETLGLARPIRAHIRLDGQSSKLQLRGQARLGEQALTLSGTLSREGWRLGLAAAGLNLAGLVEGAPDAVVHGKLEASSGSDVETIVLRPALSSLYYAGWELRDLRGRSRFSEGQLQLETLHMDLGGGRLQLSGKVDRKGDMDLRLTGDFPDLSITERLGVNPGIHAPLSAGLRIQRSGDRLDVNGNLSLNRIRHQLGEAARLTVEGSITDLLRRPEADLLLRATDLQLAGLKLKQASLLVRGQAASGFRIELTAAHRRWGRLRLGGRLSQQDAAWRLASQRVDLRLAKSPPWKGSLRAELTESRDLTGEILIRNGAQRITARSTVHAGTPGEVKGSVHELDLALLERMLGLPLGGISGRASGTLDWRGASSNGEGPRLVMELEGAARNFMSFPRFEVEGQVIHQDGLSRIDTRFGIGGESRIAVTGQARARQPDGGPLDALKGKLDLSVGVTKLPLENTWGWLLYNGLPLPRGSLDAQLLVKGRAAEPSFTLKSEVENLIIDDSSPVNLELSMSSDREKTRLDSLRVSDTLGPILTVTGVMASPTIDLLQRGGLARGLEGRWKMEADIPERRLDQLPRPVQIDSPWLAAANVVLGSQEGQRSGRARASLRWPQGEKLSPCGVDQVPVFKADATLSQDQLKLWLLARVGQTRLMNLEIAARSPLDDWLAGEPALRQVSMEGQLVAEELADLPLVCEHLAGPLRVTVQGERLEGGWPQLAVQLHSDALQMIAPRGDPALRIAVRNRATRMLGPPLRLSANGGVEGPRLGLSFSLEDPGGGETRGFATLELDTLLQGEASDGDDEPGDEGKQRVPLAEIQAELRKADLGALSIPLQRGWSGSGVLDGSLRASLDRKGPGGADPRLRLDGALAMRDGRIRLTSLGQQLEDVALSMNFEGERIEIEKLYLRDGAGTLQASGQLDLEGLTPGRMQVEAQLDAFPFRREGLAVSTLTGKLSGDTSFRARSTRTEVTVKGLEVEISSAVERDLQPLEPHPDIRILGKTPSANQDGSPRVYEVVLDAEKSTFWVRSPDMAAEGRARLDLLYREPDLRVWGHAQLLRGFFEMYGKRFELEESRMGFDGSPGLDPLVDLRALHETSTGEVEVLLTGRASAPTIRFSHSSPEVQTTGQVIAALLGQEEGDPTRMDTSATSAAASFMAGMTAGLLTEQVREKLGGVIPVLAIESGDEAFRNARIRAGVQLDRFIREHLGPLAKVVRGAYIEGFVSRQGEDSNATGEIDTGSSPGGGLLELRFPSNLVGTFELQPSSGWRVDMSWEP